MAEPKPYQIETESGQVLEIETTEKTGCHWFFKTGGQRFWITTKANVLKVVKKLGFEPKED